MLVVISLVSSSPCCVLFTQTKHTFNVTTRLYSTRKHIKNKKPQKKLLSLGPGPFTLWFRAALRKTAKNQKEIRPLLACFRDSLGRVCPCSTATTPAALFTLLESACRGFCNPWTTGANQPSTWGDIPVKGKVYIYIGRGSWSFVRQQIFLRRKDSCPSHFFFFHALSMTVVHFNEGICNIITDRCPPSSGLHSSRLCPMEAASLH